MSLRNNIIFGTSITILTWVGTILTAFWASHEIAFFDRAYELSNLQLQNHLELENQLLMALNEAHNLAELELPAVDSPLIGIVSNINSKISDIANVDQKTAALLKNRSGEMALFLFDMFETHQMASRGIGHENIETLMQKNFLLDRRLEDIRNILESLRDHINLKQQSEARSMSIEMLVNEEKLDQYYVQKIAPVLDTIILDKREVAHAERAMIQSYLKISAILLVGAIIINSLILSFLIGVVLIRIYRGINNIAKGVSSLMRGDFDRDIVVEGRDAVNELARSFNNMAKKIAEQKMTMINHAKLSALGEMASNIGHEIKNPLSVIRCNTYLMQKALSADLPDTEKMRCYTEIIEATSMRINTIINGLKTYSRASDHDPFEPVLLSTIIDDTLVICTAKLEESNIELTVSDFSTDIMIPCRPSQIGQVLLNLIGNACDAIAGTVGKKWITLDVQLTACEVNISLTDCGNGIDPVIREKIMDPFFTTKKQGDGTGLGLSISKRIIDEHRGLLYLDADCSHTRFIVQLPCVISTDKVS